MTEPTLKIHMDNPTGNGDGENFVEICGKRLPGVRKIELNIDVGQMPEAILHITPKSNCIEILDELREMDILIYDYERFKLEVLERKIQALVRKLWRTDAIIHVRPPLDDLQAWGRISMEWTDHGARFGILLMWHCYVDMDVDKIANYLIQISDDAQKIDPRTMWLDHLWHVDDRGLYKMNYPEGI